MGVFSHFSTGETKESPTAYRQFQLYQQALAQLQAAGIDPVRRAETLSLEEFAAVANEIAGKVYFPANDGQMKTESEENNT